jgi:hypothetical protein
LDEGVKNSFSVLAVLLKIAHLPGVGDGEDLLFDQEADRLFDGFGRERFLEVLLDRVGERAAFGRALGGGVLESLDEEGVAFVGAEEERDFGEAGVAGGEMLVRFEMGDQGIEALVLGNDVDVGARVGGEDLADFVGEDEVESVLAPAGCLDEAELAGMLLEELGEGER